MGVPRRRLHLPVAEQLPDHRQPLAQGERTERVGVPQVVKPDPVEAGSLANAVPGVGMWDILEAMK